MMLRVSILADLLAASAVPAKPAADPLKRLLPSFDTWFGNILSVFKLERAEQGIAALLNVFKTFYRTSPTLCLAFVGFSVLAFIWSRRRSLFGSSGRTLTSETKEPRSSPETPPTASIFREDVAADFKREKNEIARRGSSAAWGRRDASFDE